MPIKNFIRICYIYIRDIIGQAKHVMQCFMCDECTKFKELNNVSWLNEMNGPTTQQVKSIIRGNIRIYIV